MDIIFEVFYCYYGNNSCNHKNYNLEVFQEQPAVEFELVPNYHLIISNSSLLSPAYYLVTLELDSVNDVSLDKKEQMLEEDYFIVPCIFPKTYMSILD